MFNILIKTITDQKKSLLFWIAGIVFLVGLLIAIFPSVRDSAADLQKFIENLPPTLRDTFIGGDLDFGSPVGYLTSRLFSALMPVLMIFYAVSAGSGSIAGEQDKGTLDTLLSNPIQRWQIVLGKYGGFIVTALFLVAVAAVAVLVGAPIIDMDLPTQKLIETFVSVFLLTLAFGSFAFFLGAATGNRGLSVGLSVAVAVSTYLIHTLAPAVSLFEDIHWISPFYHYIGENPLVVGLQYDHAGILLAVSLVFLVLSLIFFQKRDIKS